MKKIISLSIIILVIATTFNIIYSHNAKAASRNEDFFLECLGITDGIEKSETDMINRAEFTAMVVRALNISKLSVNDGSFADIDDEFEFVNEIYTAKALRITNGTSATTFSPDDGLKVTDACKMLVIALGYENKAEALGSYPTGYIRCASELKLTDGIGNTSNSVDFNIAKTLIYNALYANVLDVDSVGIDEITYASNGKNLLEVNFKLTCVDGVISTVGYMTDDVRLSEKGKVAVNGILYDVTFDCSDFFGKKAKIWYTKDGMLVKAIDISEINDEIIINADDIDKFSNNTLYVYGNSNKVVSYRFDASFGFIKNGRIIPHTASDFNFNEGTIKLIDNNGDRMYDYCLCWNTEYFVPKSVNKASQIIYDDKSEYKTISFENDIDCEYFIKIYDKDSGEYKNGSINDIEIGNALQIYMSDDEKFCKVVAGGEIISGRLNEISNESLLVGETSYKTNTYFEKRNITLNAGEEYNFVIAADGTICCIDSIDDSSWAYGYVLGFDRGTGISELPILKLLAMDNNIKIYELADKVRIDGAITNNSDRSIDSLFINGTVCNYSVIKYRINSEEKISHIDTPTQGRITDNIEKSYDNNNSLTKYADKTPIVYKVSGSVAIPNFTFKKSLMVYVPQSLASGTDVPLDDELFNVGTTSNLLNDRSYTIDAYDINENYYPELVVVYMNKNKVDNLEIPHANAAAYMVDKVTDALDSDGTETKKLYLFNAGKYYQYNLSSKLVNKFVQEGKIPSNGDIIRVVLNGRNEIIGLSIDVKYNAASKSAVINYGIDNLSQNANAELSYISGNVITVDEGALVLTVDQKPTPSAGDYINGIAPLSLTKQDYTIFNKTTGEVYAGRLSDVYDHISDNSYVVCEMNYYGCVKVYLYIN